MNDMTEDKMPTGESRLVRAESALQAAADALSAARAVEAQAIREIKAAHKSAIDGAQAALSAAQAELRRAQNESVPDHEWVGRRVYRMEPQYSGSGYFRTRSGEKRVVGVAFTHRHGIDLGPGWTWNKPEVGTPMVRLLKKDGAEGAKTVSLLAANKTPLFKLEGEE